MPLSESDTRAKLIDPAIHRRGWTEDLIRREETAGAIEIGDSGPRRRARGRIDYVLRVKVTSDSQPVAIAIIEAKAEHLPPNHGLEQAKLYASCKRLNVLFVFSSNGHLFVEFDRATGQTSPARAISDFPAPADLRRRYEGVMGFRLDSPAAAPLLARYPGGEATRRYYQDAAIRAALEKLARGGRRVLLSLATGSGKTFIAVHLLKRIADAGQLRRALFVCDRDELRSQGIAAFQAVFGNDAAAVSSSNPQKNARILVATYQTLDVASEESDASFLLEHYPRDYFSHIVIDECHRSAWGKWSQVLMLNPSAAQIGLTATPRRLAPTERNREAAADEEINADNLAWFGDPVYEYDMAQGIEDGYLAACEIRQFDLFHDNKSVNERVSGVARGDLVGRRLRDADTGEQVAADEAREHYDAASLEDKLLMPERVTAMASSLFAEFLATGGPEQKAIIFCARDRHADDVAAIMNNLYAEWCTSVGRKRAEPYAFKCTAASGGNEYLADLRGASRHHYVACTVDLLTTGVDVPCVRNIVFFKYVCSPIAFYQMVGRGTRLHPPDGKMMFRVYDYTDATRLFGEAFVSTHQRPRKRTPGPTEPPERTISVEGIDVHVTPAGRYIVTEVDGKATPVTVEEYKARLAQRLVEVAPSLEQFRSLWVVPVERRALIDRLPDSGRSAGLVRDLEEMSAFDLFDVLGELGYGLAPKTREERAEAFQYKHAEWLRGLPAPTASVLRALTGQFAKAGTAGLESPAVFQTSEVANAGGVAALRQLGRPADVLMDTKVRMFAA